MSERDKQLIGGIPHDIEPLANYMTYDDGDQIELHTEREWIAEQEPRTMRALGAYCVSRAGEFLKIAQYCQEELVELGEIAKPRTRAIDLTKRAAVFDTPEPETPAPVELVESVEAPPMSRLDQAVAEKFVGMSNAQIIHRMERATDFGYDDEEYELNRRLKDSGMTWRWDREVSPERVVIYRPEDGDA